MHEFLNHVTMNFSWTYLNIRSKLGNDCLAGFPHQLNNWHLWNRSEFFHWSNMFQYNIHCIKTNKNRIMLPWPCDRNFFSILSLQGCKTFKHSFSWAFLISIVILYILFSNNYVNSLFDIVLCNTLFSINLISNDGNVYWNTI